MLVECYACQDIVDSSEAVYCKAWDCWACDDCLSDEDEDD